MSDLNVMHETGVSALSDPFHFSTIGPGAEKGIRAIFQIPPHDRRSFEMLVNDLLFLTVVANKLVCNESDNPLQRAVGQLCLPVRHMDHPELWASGRYVLSLYDVQVALCEFHRWGQPPKRTTANRKPPEDYYMGRITSWLAPPSGM